MTLSQIGAGVSGVSTVFGEVPDACYIGNVYTKVIDAGTAAPVFVDADGKLGTAPMDAHGNKMSIPSLKDLQRTGILNQRVEEQQATIAELKSTVAQLTTRLTEQAAQFQAQFKEQAAEIQKVSAQLELSKSAPRTVLNSR